MDNAQITIDNGQGTIDNSQLSIVNSPLVPPGYKQTEVGVIPKDWEVKPFHGLFDISGGYSASRAQLSSEGYCYLHYGDIHKSTSTFIDAQSEYQDIPKLDIPLTHISPASLLHDGDVVFVDASEDDEGASKHIVVVNKDDIPFVSGLHTIVLKSKSDILDHKYRRYCFQTRNVKHQFRYYAVGTKVIGISKTNIAKLLLPIPTLAEQEAIAAALSDADALIEALEQLIAKKRQVKQGAMQELLTGKRRLPGFSGEWTVRTLGSLGRFRGGNGFPTAFQGAVEGDYPFFKVSDMNNEGNSTFMTTSNNWVSESTRQQINANIFPRDTIVFAKIGAAIFLERKRILLQDSCLDNNMMGYVLDPGMAHCRFMHYLFQITELGKLVAATALPALNGKDIAALSYSFPSLKEQTAIAAILSDMDAEITALEAKLAKARQVKQGMMQELLTGRTRLIENG